MRTQELSEYIQSKVQNIKPNGAVNVVIAKHWQKSKFSQGDAIGNHHST